MRMRFGGLAQLGEHLPYKQGVSGSIPLTSILNDDSLAQLVEHLTFNQRVTGSSPVRVIFICGCGGIGRRTRFRI